MGSGRIAYEINVEDKTSAGIKTASDNLNKMAKNAQNLQSAFNPAQAMQAGAFGLSLAGLGAVGTQMLSVTKISQQVGNATNKACNGIRTLGNNSSETSQKLAQISSTIAAVSGSVVVLGTAIPTAISLIKTFKQSSAVYKETIALHKCNILVILRRERFWS